MMLQRSGDSHSLPERVARLTPKERECLDRWLNHATAKEIALELGITHHAVEKRLKSARAKLGVASTLDAARLLAAVEGYGSTASQSPEVAAPAPAEQDGPAAAPLSHAGPGRGVKMIAGAIVMSLFLLALFALSAQPQAGSGTAATTPERKVVVVNRKDGSTVDLASALAGTFGRMDKNGDKFIAGDELNARFQVMRTMIRKGETTPAPAVTTLPDFDTDGDKRVSEAEFQAGMASLSRRP